MMVWPETSWKYADRNASGRVGTILVMTFLFGTILFLSCLGKYAKQVYSFHVFFSTTVQYTCTVLYHAKCVSNRQLKVIQIREFANGIPCLNHLMSELLNQNIKFKISLIQGFLFSFVCSNEPFQASRLTSFDLHLEFNLFLYCFEKQTKRVPHGEQMTKGQKVAHFFRHCPKNPTAKGHREPVSPYLQTKILDFFEKKKKNLEKQSIWEVGTDITLAVCSGP